MFLVMLPIGALAGLLVAAVVTYMMPKMYESEAVIEVRPRMSASGAVQSPEMFRMFLATEFSNVSFMN